MSYQHIAVVGATSGIATACIHAWCQQPPQLLTLLGRDHAKLTRLSNDLQVRYPTVTVEILVLDCLNTQAIEQAVIKLYQGHPIDVLLIAQGVLPQTSSVPLSVTEVQQVLAINAVSPVLFAEAVLAKMVEINHGVCVLIGSVAGDRGRQSNYCYGAAKSLLQTYAQGWQHRLALLSSKVHVVLVKPGPTATPMTLAWQQQGKSLASPQAVARDIVAAVLAKKPVIYTPGRWRMIMWIIRHMPRIIFHRCRI